MEDRRPRDANGHPLADDEIRVLVRAKLADGTLPQEPPGMVPVVSGQRTQYMMSAGSPQADPCAVCGKGATEITLNYPAGPISFHRRCHAIWLEEAGKP